jgi:DHA1 family bicyclomycin/chloramphenicol resistance-like MFS transporter
MSKSDRGRLLGLTIILGLLSMLGPIGIDSFLASIPNIAADFHTTSNIVAISISALMIGNAVGQIFQGPLADRFGRKPVILGILAIYTLTAVGAALSPSVEALFAWRFFQGTAQSGGRILAATVARDLFDRERLGKLLADISVAMSLAAIIGPIAGGQIALHLPWQTSLFVMAVFGVFVFVLFVFFFKETSRGLMADATKPLVVLANLVEIWRNAAFRKYVLCSAFSLSGFVAFLSASAPVLIGAFGVRPDNFGYMYAILSLFFLAGTFMAGRLVMRMGINALIGWGVALVSVGGVAMAWFALLDNRAPEAVFVPMAIYAAGFALLMAQTSAGALQPFVSLAGTASTMIGFTQSVLAALISIMLNMAEHSSALPMALTIAAAGLISAAIYLFAIWPDSRRRN